MSVMTKQTIFSVASPAILSLLFLVTIPLNVSAAPGHSGGHEDQGATSPAVKTDDSHQSGGEHADERTDTVASAQERNVDGGTPATAKSSSSEPGWETLMPGLAGAPNAHPMLVHFPIVFLVTATLFFCLSWFTYAEHFLMLGRWMFWLGLVTLPVVAASGFWAIGGWGDGHVTGHRNLMVLTTVLAYLVFGIGRWVSNRKRLYRIVLTVGLILVTVFMTLGADRGAYLVFVEGAGVQSAQHQHGH